MKLVKEHINFQRGLDPKDAMGTGLSLAKYNEPQNDIDRGFELVDEYLIKVKGVKNWNLYTQHNWALSRHFQPNIKTWLNEMTPPKIIGNRIYKLLKQNGLLESINFERGIDPKRAMGTGSVFMQIREDMEKVFKELVNEYGGEYTIEEDPFSGVKKQEYLRGTYFFKTKNVGSIPPEPAYRHYSFRLEYEPWREHQLTVALSIRGGNYSGYYIESIEEGAEYIRKLMEKYAN